MTSVKESSKKRHLDGRIKLQASKDNPFIDLTNDSDQESSASSKRAKSTSSLKASLPYLSSRPSSTNNSQSRLTTPSNHVSVKKPLFKSPPWQKKIPFPQQDGAGSTKSAPTPRRFLTSNGSAVRPSKDVSEIPEKSRSTPLLSSVRSLSDADDGTKRKHSHHRDARPGKNIPQRKYSDHEVSTRASYSTLEKEESEDELVLFGTTRKFLSKSDSLKSQPEPITNSSVHQKPSKATKVDKGIKSKRASRSGTQTPSSESAYSKYEAVQTKSQRRSPQATDITPKKSPGRPRIAVEIPKSPSRALLEKSRKRLPRRAVNAAKGITPKEARRNRAANLILELKKDVSVACSRASTVEEIFGSHGLSEHYDDAASIEAKRKARAQPKAKKVKISNIKLDWGEVPQAAKVFNPVKIIPSAEQAEHLLEAKFQDISTGPLLTFFNNRNEKRIDGKFQFVDSYVHRDPPKKAQATAADFGCTCSHHCDPTDPTCRCSQTSGTKLVPYVKRPDGLVVLDPYFIDSFDGEPQEIFECNNACNCTQDCFNRVVQKGRTVPLQIFMTAKCGFGIRSPLPIKKGQFIDVYLGELLTTKQVEEYENASSEKSSSYIFSLDFFRDQPTYHIQGLHFGSPTRFINHSCNPNARTFTVMMNHADQKIYKLAYFAIKDIPAMKEITFDYSPKEEKWVPTPGEEEDEGVVRCLCGEKNCRGRLWSSKRQTARRGRGKGLARY